MIENTPAGYRNLDQETRPMLRTNLQRDPGGMPLIAKDAISDFVNGVGGMRIHAEFDGLVTADSGEETYDGTVYLLSHESLEQDLEDLKQEMKAGWTGVHFYAVFYGTWTDHDDIEIGLGKGINVRSGDNLIWRMTPLADWLLQQLESEVAVRQEERDEE